MNGLIIMSKNKAFSSMTQKGAIFTDDLRDAHIFNVGCLKVYRFFSILEKKGFNELSINLLSPKSV